MTSSEIKLDRNMTGKSALKIIHNNNMAPFGFKENQLDRREISQKYGLFMKRCQLNRTRYGMLCISKISFDFKS